MPHRTVELRPLFVCLSLAVVVAFLLTQCAANAPLDYDQLRADPAYAIRMPGAGAIGEAGGRRAFTLAGEQPAFATRVYWTDASASDVYAYYAREVERLGWVYTGSNGRATTELEVRYWCKPYAEVRIAIEDPSKLGPGSGSYPTRFDVSIIGSRSERDAITCPVRP
jgi:hypothetical protein